MPSSVCISIQSAEKTDAEEIVFFETEEWSLDAEQQFLAKIQDIFAIARKLSRSAKVSISFETAEVKELSFSIQRKINLPVIINQQKLSVREIEVLGLIMQGLTNNEIAEKLFISYETVKSHRKNILDKTRTKNTAALINYYHQTFFEK